ncbi:MAG: TRAP transporter small permease [Pyramidobacter sp.]|uniref:TRAP transporter small permease n=1 Tax=Pyramidobacter sp. TaxID=1943581 RepID=UPI002A82C332|nr:TRAP transporter small permease [Pyramidobacter sp.]MDY4032583.1 TRAP transporter small permease [Pyramidobacter sp.]
MIKIGKAGQMERQSLLSCLSEVIGYILDHYINPFMMAALACVVFFQVVNRLIFHISAAWSEEIGRYIFVWASLLGAASGIRKNAHLNVEIVRSVLPSAFRSLLVITSDLICVFFFGVLCYEGSKWIIKSGFKVLADSMDIPMFYIQIIIPASAILMLIFTLEHLHRVIFKKR